MKGNIQIEEKENMRNLTKNSFFQDNSFYSSLGLFNFYELIVYIAVISFLYLIIYFYLSKFSVYPLNYVMIILYPIIFLATYISYNYSLKSKFSIMLKREEPLLYLFLSILGRNFSLERVIYIIYFSPFTKFLNASRMLFRRWLTKFYLTGDPIDEIIFEDVDNIPDESFKKYLKELIRVSWVGGDIAHYLKSSLKIYYDSIKETWSNAWKEITGYLEIIILVFGLFPSLLSSLIFLIGFDTTVSIFTISFLIYPFISFMVYLIVNEKSPNLPEISSPKSSVKAIIFSITILIASSSILYIVDAFKLEYILFFTSISFFPLSLSNIRSILYESRIDSEILVFLRELEELMKGGLSIIEALNQINLARYPRELSEGIRELIVRYENNIQIEKIYSEKSFNSLTILKVVLAEIIYSGGGLDEIIELKDLLESNYRVSIFRRASSILPIITSIIVILLGGYSTWVIKRILTGVGEHLTSNPMFINFSLNALMNYSKLFLLFGAVYTGILIDKVAFGKISTVISLNILIFISSLAMMLNFM